MYSKFFGFDAKPFNLTPDPKFLYLGKAHKESYAQLFYSLNENAGFVVLIGEVGTGKTTICRSFLKQLPQDCNLAYIFNPAQDEIELLKSLNKELGIEYEFGTKKELQDVLYNYLLEQEKAGKKVLVLIDEAQNLSPVVLEQIRLLSNLETETKKLIQIILVGQPELDDMLNGRSLRQLRQRVSVWCRLAPLNYDEMVEYINHRIRMAGGASADIFGERVLREIFRFSHGTPRLINLVCDRALLAGYASGERKLSVSTIKKCVEDVAGTTPKRENLWAGYRFAVPAATMAVAAVLYAAFLPVSQGKPVAYGTKAQKQTAPRPAAPLPVAASPSQSIETFFDKGSRMAAVNGLFARWGIQDAAGSEDEPLTIQEIAKKRKMDCFVGNIDKTLLGKLNYPAILVLNDEKGRTGFMPVTGIWGNGFETGPAGPAVGLDLALKYWGGETYVFWNDFFDVHASLQRSDVGNPVRQLQLAMEKLGYLERGNDVDGIFGPKTERAVTRFQQENKLVPDGVAGDSTIMLIFSVLPEYKTPHLL
ncbi:MAG: AAA family ATPase [Nitrospinae bacterium]|nr:AAA family ATPase [Nitrospinota bacterium]